MLYLTLIFAPYEKGKTTLNVDPVKSAQRRLNYEGYYSRNQLVRLAEAVNQVLSDVEAKLSFTIDPQKLVVMQGKAEVDVMLICQPLRTTVSLSFILHF